MAGERRGAILPPGGVHGKGRGIFAKGYMTTGEPANRFRARVIHANYSQPAGFVPVHGAPDTHYLSAELS